MRITKNNVLDRVFDICNLGSLDDDIVTKTMYKYKCIANESEEVREAIYNYIIVRMGYANKLDDKDNDLIEKEGY